MNRSEITDQELAVRVFDWYVRTDRLPPKREDVARDETGLLKVPEHLLAFEFTGPTWEQTTQALDIMVDQHTSFGGPLGSPRAGIRSAQRPTTRSRTRSKNEKVLP